MEGFQPLLQGLGLLIEPVIALFELRHGDDALNAHLQQAVLFCPKGCQVLLNAADVLGVVVLVGDGLEDRHHRVDDGLFVPGKLIEDVSHDLV